MQLKTNPITSRQIKKINALALFTEDRKKKQFINEVSKGRTSDLQSLTREEAFELLKKFTDQTQPLQTI
jgi:hypothetical protein